MIRSVPAQEVADVLAITFEREDAAGNPWCPPRDAATVRHWVVDRSRELGGGLRRIVRLARLFHAADGRDYSRFLYGRLTTLRGRNFEAQLRAAAREGRLGAAFATLGPAGVMLREPALRPGGTEGEGFEIGYAQMPRLGALLDILHNVLGYAEVAEALMPVLGRSTAMGAADEVARLLHVRLNAWLAERLESPHHLRQAQQIRAFVARCGKLAPETIDDALILAFWRSMAEPGETEEIEGFRLFTSAASSLLRYRQALRDELQDRALSRAADLGSDSRSVDLDRLVPAELAVGSWQSPLVGLARPPASKIKWLNKRERLQLANYLAGPQPGGDGEDSSETADDDAGLPAHATGLAGAERFDLQFKRTLLRADVFGAAQAVIVAWLRKRSRPDDAIATALAAIGDDAYALAKAAYLEIRHQVRLECLAALQALMEAGAAEALVVLEHLAGHAALREFIAESGSPSDTLSTRPALPRADVAAEQGAAHAAEEPEPGQPDPARIATLLAALLAQSISAPGPLRETLAAARAAARKVNREGFRPADREAPDGMKALGAGLVSVIALDAELARLDAALERADLVAEARADRGDFLSAFRALYAREAGA